MVAAAGGGGKGFVLKPQTPEEWQLLTTQVASITGFILFNIGLNEFNSWALKKPPAQPGFNFPVFYTMFHMVASCLGTTVIMCFRPPETGYPNARQFWVYKYVLILNSACSTLNISLNNVSLTLISLFLNQVIKATAPAPTLVLSAIIEGKRFTWPVIISTALIITGTVLAVPMSSDSGTKLSGIIAAITSTFAASLKTVVMSVIMRGTAERPRLSPTAVMWYDFLLAFLMMLVYWLASAERVGSIDYIKEHPSWAVGIILGGSSMAFAFNVSNYMFVLTTSALTVVVTSNGVKVILLVISAIQDHLGSAREWSGVALTACSIIAYAFFTYRAKGKPVPPLWPPFAKAPDPEAGKGGEIDADELRKAMVSESTPLKKEELQGSCLPETCCAVM